MRMQSSCGKRYKLLFFLILSISILNGCNNIKQPEQSTPTTPTTSTTSTTPTAEPEITINNNVYINDINFGGMTDKQAMKTLVDYSASVNIAKKEASYNEKDWGIVIKGENGKSLNIEKTLELLLAANEETKVEPVIDTTTPSHTVAELKSKITKISSYKTKIYDTVDTRMNNLVLSCKYIDGFVLNSGDIFSFNGIVGETTKEKGYQDGHMYLKDKDGKVNIVDAPGGGICQVSSTLFNAADGCGMTIVERHEHSKDVGYVPEGRDASISIGTLDFKFQNNRDKKIMIKIKVEKKYVVSWILERAEIE